MNYFIGDLHFGHVNCLSFDNRPFKTIEDHDAVLIKNWNNVVGIEDDVYILGDISWYNTTKTLEILKQLNGHIHLIRGNHDHKHLKNRELQSMFVEITDYKELHIPGTDDKKNSNGVVLCHYPIPCFNHHYYGWCHLYAHVHNSFEWNMMERIKYEMNELYRDWETGEIKGLDLSGEIDQLSGKDILIVDDICSKGGTFYHSALKLKELGAANIYLYVTHCENSIYDGELLKNNGLIEKIYTTDSILTNTESPKIELVEEFRKNDPGVF